MNQQNNQAVPPRRSMRLATIIPASHWISMGYSELDARLMEKLQQDMKNYRDGSDETEIRLEGRMGPIAVLPYHDILLPHWNSLFKALNGRTSTKRLFFTGISLPASVLDIMFPVLQSMNLEALGLIKVGWGENGLLKLSSFLSGNSSIKQLLIGWDTIDESVASALSDAINNHPSIKTIRISNCGYNTAVLRIFLEGCKELNILTLTDEDLGGSEAIAPLADFIRGNHPLETLDLSYNKISDNEAVLLVAALKKNTNLKRMHLHNNKITEEGEKALLKAIYNPTSMDSIIESNHSCKVYTYEKSPTAKAQRPPIETEVFSINREDITIRQKIRRKVVLALCRVDGGLFDLSHFNDLPLQLMPRVLELIQGHTKMRESKNTPLQLEKDALSRLFHTLRGWELPLLFNNLRTQVPTGKRKRRKTCHYQ